MKHLKKFKKIYENNSLLEYDILNQGSIDINYCHIMKKVI